ncbi:MAG: periplasmic heavy metal sensor [Candidatus Binatia bacterium]
MNRKLQFAFLVSLLVNVFLIGVLLGELPHHFNERVSREERMEKALKELPEPLQTQLREKMGRMREGSESIRKQIQEAREEAIRILITEPFDGTAYDRQVSTIHELYGQRSKRMAEVVKEVAKDVSLEHRQALAEVLKRPPPSSPR